MNKFRTILVIILAAVPGAAFAQAELLHRGDTMVMERGVEHSFSSESGCVFEEISSTHWDNDSFYADEASFAQPRKTLVYLTRDVLEG